MTGFLVVRDPDPSRRAAATDEALSRLRARGAHDGGSFVRGDTTVVWAGYPGAPIAHHHDDGIDALIVGDAILPGADGPSSAAQVADHWRVTDPVPDPTDGHHATVIADVAGALWVETDPLGYFHVHATELDEVTLIGSAIALLDAHPSFVARFDPVGLAALLATNSIVDGRTAYDGVDCVRSGHVLCADRRGLRQVESYRLSDRTELSDAPIPELIADVGDQLTDACRRHLRDARSVALSLSGGLDSRLVAGRLADAGIDFTGVTHGRATDNEYRFAARVAAVVGCDHELRADSGAAENLLPLLRWEGLLTTPTLSVGDLGAAYSHAVGGHALDNSLGGSYVERCYDDERREIGFDPFFRRLNVRGVAPDLLASLASPEVAETAVQSVEAAYMRLGDTHMARSWSYALQHSDRFWVANTLGRQTATQWPAQPHLDRRLLDVPTRVPLALLGGRRFETDCVRQLHPDLARIPLDKTTAVTTAIEPQLADLLRNSLGRKARLVARRLRVPTRETRYFTRTLDFDGPVWRAVRRAHEPARARLHAMFDPTSVDALWPAPEATHHEAFGFPASNPAKQLLAVAALLEDGVEPPA